MQIKISILICLISLSLALESRKHNYYYNSYYQPYTKTQSARGSAAGGVIIVVILLIIGCSYFFCCRKCFNRNPTQFSQNQTNPPHNQNFNANPAFMNPPYSLAPPQYQQGFRQPMQGTIINPNQAFNPYVTSAIDRLTQQCDMCSIKNKIGEEPRVMLNCSDHHFFHLSCIGFVIQSPNIICPRCREICPPQITLFCSSCKEKNVIINAFEYLKPAGGLDVDALKGRYG